MPKTIFSVNFDIPGGEIEYVQFRSDRSLLDADIVAFEPSILSLYDSHHQTRGKPVLSVEDSFRAAEDISHWHSEFQGAFDAGKTIFVFLSKLEEFRVYTGATEVSGIGRNQKVTKLVKLLNNYSALPLSFEAIVSGSGTQMKIAQDLKFISGYWQEFKGFSVYEVYLEGKFERPIFMTKTGNKIVGAIISGKKGGTFVLLPPLRYDEEKFTRRDKKTGNEYWNSKATVFGKKLIGCLVEIENALRTNREATPVPDWVRSTTYKLSRELKLEAEIASISSQVAELSNRQNELALQLEAEGAIRWLLYERGPALEEAILEALRLLGFEAARLKERGSEFDAVFNSPEGRFLGEAEGKDNTAINIDKLSQLERNLHEDYAREEITEYAKGVLFGNAHRLKPPHERPDFFTRKCVTGAQRANIALVRTTDLFAIAKYLKEKDDRAFAQMCREAMMQTAGNVVEFPRIPEDLEEAKVSDSGAAER